MDFDQMDWQLDTKEDFFGHCQVVPPLQTTYFGTHPGELWAYGQESLKFPTACFAVEIVPTNKDEGAPFAEVTEEANSNQSTLDTIYTSQAMSAAVPWSKRRTKCSICGLIVLQRTLKRHVRDKHDSQKTSLECANCNESCKRLDILNRHMNEQHGEESGQSGSVDCAYCRQIVRRRAWHDHLKKSQKCTAAREAFKTSAVSPTAATRVDSSNYVPLSWIGLESVIDPETSCCFAFASLYDAWSCHFYSENEPGGPQRIVLFVEENVLPREFWIFRGLAMRSISRELESTSRQTSAPANLVAKLDSLAAVGIKIFSVHGFGDVRTTPTQWNSEIKEAREREALGRGALERGVLEASQRLSKLSLRSEQATERQAMHAEYHRKFLLICARCLAHL